MTTNRSSILVVDDTEANIDILVELLGDDHDVMVAMDGAMALESVQENRTDIILLDIMMPEMDGPTTLMELRKLPGLADTPAAFMTAKVMPADLDYYRSIGALDVVAKPFDPMTLATRVAEIWEADHGA